MDFINRNFVRAHLLLGIVLFFALAIRLFGIHHGLPYGYQIDEKFIVNHAMGFGIGDLNPHVFHWPGTSLMYFIFFEYALFFIGGWLLGFFPTTADFAEFFVIDPSVFYLIGRITTALIGTATVLLIYQLGKKMYSARAGLLAALFIAFSYLTVGIDHFIFPDTPLTFLCVLAMLFFYQIFIHGKISTYILAGLIIGIAIATKYSGGALIIPLILAHSFRVHKEHKRWIFTFGDKRIVIALVMVVAGFILFCPFSILDFSKFYQDVSWQFSHVHSGGFGTDVENAWGYYLFRGLPLSLGFGLTIISIIAVVYVIFRHKKKDMLVAVFVLFYFLYIGSWKVGVDKYLLPILPFLALFAGMLADKIFSRFNMSRPFVKPLLILSVLLLISEPFARSIHNDYLLIQKDTRTKAKEWIEENIPAGAKIAIDAGNFDVAKFSPPLNDSVESLKAKSRQLEKESPQIWASSADKIGQYLQIKMKYQKDEGYYLIHIIHNLDGKIDKKVSLDEFKKNNVEYVVVSSYAYQVYEDPIFKKRNTESAKFYSDFYSSLEKYCNLVNVFYPLSKKGPGPVIKIYKISY